MGRLQERRDRSNRGPAREGGKRRCDGSKTPPGDFHSTPPAREEAIRRRKGIGERPGRLPSKVRVFCNLYATVHVASATAASFEGKSRGPRTCILCWYAFPSHLSGAAQFYCNRTCEYGKKTNQRGPWRLQGKEDGPRADIEFPPFGGRFGLKRPFQPARRATLLRRTRESSKVCPHPIRDGTAGLAHRASQCWRCLRPSGSVSG